MNVAFFVPFPGWLVRSGVRSSSKENIEPTLTTACSRSDQCLDREMRTSSSPVDQPTRRATRMGRTHPPKSWDRPGGWSDENDQTSTVTHIHIRRSGVPASSRRCETGVRPARIWPLSLTSSDAAGSSGEMFASFSLVESQGGAVCGDRDHRYIRDAST